MRSIKLRRSVRQFSNQFVTNDMIDSLLHAGMQAPSAGNEQAWDFIVIRSKETLHRIKEIHPHAQMLEQVSVAICVCGNLQKIKFDGFWVQDCSAATENILLQCVELGLGAVWLGVYPLEDRVKAISSILELPNHIIPLNLIPIGYPNQKISHIDRFKKENVHYEKWVL